MALVLPIRCSNVYLTKEGNVLSALRQIASLRVGGATPKKTKRVLHSEPQKPQRQSESVDSSVSLWLRVSQNSFPLCSGFRKTSMVLRMSIRFLPSLSIECTVKLLSLSPFSISSTTFPFDLLKKGMVPEHLSTNVRSNFESDSNVCRSTL